VLVDPTNRIDLLSNEADSLVFPPNSHAVHLDQLTCLDVYLETARPNVITPGQQRVEIIRTANNIHGCLVYLNQLGQGKCTAIAGFPLEIVFFVFSWRGVSNFLDVEFGPMKVCRENFQFALTSKHTESFRQGEQFDLADQCRSELVVDALVESL